MNTMWRYNENVRDFVSDYDDFKHEDLTGNIVNFAGVKTVEENWIDSPFNPRKYLSYNELNNYAKTLMHIDDAFDYVSFSKHILNKLQSSTVQMRRASAWQWGVPMR
jgi:hypothetical protein